MKELDCKMAVKKERDEILRTVKKSTQVMPMEEGLADQVALGNKLFHTETIDYTTSEGHHYVGDIVFKKPDILTMMKAGGIKSQLLLKAGVNNAEEKALLDPIVLTMLTVISSLEVVMVKRPDWIEDPTKVGESELLYHVYDRYLTWQDVFRPTGKNSSEGNSELATTEKALGD